MSNRAVRRNTESVLFAIDPSGHPLSPAIEAAVKIVWKFILMDFHGVDMSCSDFNARTILPRAMRRLSERILAYDAGRVKREFVASLNDKRTNSVTTANRVLRPFADIRQRGDEHSPITMEFHPKFQEYLESINCPPDYSTVE
eukprot:11603164-Prorocentrum_lima.AAC.1